MHRLFVALRPPPSTRAALLALQQGMPGARWQDDDQFHLTLRFVREVERRRAEDLVASLGTVRATAPTLQLAGVGRFEGALWAGVAPRDPLAALHRKVDRACVRAGCTAERRAYLPHITLARLSRAAAAGHEATAWLVRHAGLASDAFAPAHLTLFASRLGREGATYEAVARWPLDRIDEEMGR